MRFVLDVDDGQIPEWLTLSDVVKMGRLFGVDINIDLYPRGEWNGTRNTPDDEPAL